MSEAELMATFHDYLGQIHTVVFGYISFVSGFLIMSYLAAEKLSRAFSALVLGLYSVACCSLIFRLFLVRTDFVMLNLYIREQAENGALDLPWFGTVPTWGPQVLSILDIAITAGGFIGSVSFFLLQRRRPAEK